MAKSIVSDEVLHYERLTTEKDAKEHGLSASEFEMIQKILGRLPTPTELGIYSGLWSEHCSYKNSILLLKTLPTESANAIAKAGEENAGALDIGEGLAVVFKVESHNHPTAIEPYQGAATGVGGIMRDIFTMGARPIASLNALYFGPLDQERNRYLISRAVKGIGDYGNSLGIAVSGGQTFFHHSYSRNCLVNAMTVGIVKKDKIATAKADGVDNPVYYVGATTGRDGIHGASFASKDLSQESESKKSAVQVGDPFMEKLLLEATLELIASDSIVGIQDMGAAGLSCSSSEMSAKGDVGMDIILDYVPFREEKMNAYEIMLSESQERMLVVGKQGRDSEIEKIFQKWDLHATKIGNVKSHKLIRIYREGKLCAEIPAQSLVLGGGAPRYEREQKKPEHIDRLNKKLDSKDFDGDSLDLFYKLLQSANIASKRPIIEQYDTEVGLGRRIGPGGDAGLTRVPNTNLGIASCLDCNPRYIYLNPRVGTAQSVAESARNVAVTGAIPLGITNCLNFGNPHIPENYYMFAESIHGMGDACKAFGIPVTGGNVSFYNESEDGPVLPTPTIGMVGLHDNLEEAIQPHFQSAGDLIYLIGNFQPAFGGSEIQSVLALPLEGEIPSLDLKSESALVHFLNQNRTILASAHDISLGGLAIALFRSANAMITHEQTGFAIRIDELLKKGLSKNQVLFGETNGCAIVSVKPENESNFKKAIANAEIQAYALGKVETTQMNFGTFSAEVARSREIFESALVGTFS